VDVLSLSMVLYAMVIFCGAFIQGSLGFGLAIVSAPVLYWLNPVLVPGPVIMMALSVAAINLFRYRRTISLKGLGSAIAGRIPGSLLGGYLLTVVSGDALTLFLGSMVLLAVLVSLSRIRISATPATLCTAGFLSGVMGTATAIGGPPMALVMQHESAENMRANLSGYFVISSIVSLVILFANGYFSREQLELSLMMVPAAILGAVTAGYVSHRFSQRLLRLGVLGLCTVCGLVAILSVIMG